ncbi:group III truncated hemoglobin [Aquimarina sp. AD10]|uniref:Sec-independent protein translocase TatC n=1 Tax=Aquimarina aggregata TaxID=1642818 RepID=A0A163AT89_9FLAO|nr:MULTISPECIES: group III truncated hemoglobin [Aquimarina]AXT62882.1 group III truncated hemoglobin [Aquimarina sp. AD10]KZS40785.1 sec-independent protein translocase TatC [Aquimarina aggregata]RKM94250.1 group III truncated hemoglobin [Aquimarina sp. AD10]
MKDITTRKDIEFLMRTFYKEALTDPVIGVFFTKIAKIKLEEHLPHITNFWEQQLFRKGEYKKNVLQIHKDLHLKKELQQQDFDTWLLLFNTTVNTHFKGEQAELIKTRALSIATVIQIKTQ